MNRKSITLIFLFPLLFLMTTSALALEITSIRPDKVSPGDNLYISFKPTASSIRVVLGEQVLPPEQTDTGQLFYRVPDLSAGSYVVQFLNEGNLVATPFQLTIVEPVPQLTALNPGNIPECAESREKQIEVIGKNFIEGSRLLVNGALVASDVISREQMTFDASALRSGVYGVQVVSPADNKSLPFSLYVNSVPTIGSVSRGENYTNHYELVINGENFFQQSTLLVTEEPPGMTGVGPRQKIIWGKGRRAAANNLLDQEQEEYLFYENCNTLIYYRFPLSGQQKELTLKVINPDGKASRSYSTLAN